MRYCHLRRAWFGISSQLSGSWNMFWCWSIVVKSALCYNSKGNKYVKRKRNTKEKKKRKEKSKTAASSWNQEYYLWTYDWCLTHQRFGFENQQKLQALQMNSLEQTFQSRTGISFFLHAYLFKIYKTSSWVKWYLEACNLFCMGLFLVLKLNVTWLTQFAIWVSSDV